jgi:ribosome maturation protein SDO1
VHNEVVGIVASRLVDPKTKRVYTTGMIEKALDMLSSGGSQAKAEEKGGDEEGKAKPKEHTWTGVVATKSAKSQALEAMKALILHQPIPVMRARMKLRVTCSLAVLKQNAKPLPKVDGEEGDGEEKKATVKDRILSYVEQVDSQDTMGSEWEVIGFVEPGAFKGLSDFIGGETKGQGRVEVLDMAVTTSDD